MQAEPKIAWTKSQRARLNSAVRKYNNAIRRAQRAVPANAPFLPAQVSYQDLKASINSARTLNNTVNRLLRVTRPRALELASVGDGGIVTRYEVREFQIAKAVNERRKSLRRKKLGIDYGQTLGRMGTIQQNNLAPDTRSARDFSPVGLKRFLQRAEQMMATSNIDKVRLYYKNYITALNTVFGGYSEYDAAIASIAQKIQNMMRDEPDRILDFFESGDEILHIEYIYEPQDRETKLYYLVERWKML